MATYSIPKQRVVHPTHHGLVDGGANSDIGSDRDMRILAYDADDRCVNISGVGNHLVNDMRIASFCACAVTKSQLGLVLLVYNQYAYVPQQTQSIHSKIQMQDFGNLVCDSAIKVGGKSRIITPNGFIIPLSFTGGLAYIKHWRPTDEQMISLPQVIMTSNAVWTPTKYDDHDTLHERFHQILTTPINYTDDFYDMTGDITTNHTCITPPIDLISSTDDLDPFESALPPVLTTTFDSSFLDNLDIPRQTEPDYWDSFFDATTSRIIYHSFLDSCLEYNISASDIHDSVVALCF
jgi:hypothetical protein